MRRNQPTHEQDNISFTRERAYLELGIGKLAKLLKVGVFSILKGKSKDLGVSVAKR